MEKNANNPGVDQEKDTSELGRGPLDSVAGGGAQPAGSPVPPPFVPYDVPVPPANPFNAIVPTP